MRALRIMSPGALTTVQDFGRFGHARSGAPPSGALDVETHAVANALVGRPVGAAALEIRLVGPTLEAEGGSVRVALAGADGPLRIDRLSGESVSVGGWRSATLAPGDRLTVGPLRGSATATLAVDGLSPAPVLGSAATFMRGGFGGGFGRPLASGDRVVLDDAEPSGPERAVAPSAPDPDPLEAAIVLGPEAGRLTADAASDLTAALWVVGATSDRMGLRLEGPRLRFRPGERADIESDGVVTGVVQLPADGAPILLLADRGATGGYARVATAATADLPALGRLGPGRRVRFRVVSPAEGARLARAAAARLARRLASIAPAQDGFDTERLLSVNLVTAVVDQLDWPSAANVTQSLRKAPRI